MKTLNYSQKVHSVQSPEITVFNSFLSAFYKHGNTFSLFEDSFFIHFFAHTFLHTVLHTRFSHTWFTFSFYHILPFTHPYSHPHTLQHICPMHLPYLSISTTLAHTLTNTFFTCIFVLVLLLWKNSIEPTTNSTTDWQLHNHDHPFLPRKSFSCFLHTVNVPNAVSFTYAVRLKKIVMIWTTL
jgi:hypothetical protein